MVTIETGSTADADAVAGQWIALADSQQEFGSHLLAAANRESVRETMVRRAVSDELLVAKDEPGRENETNGDDEPGRENKTNGDGEPGDGDDSDIVGFVTFGVETGSYDVDTTRGVVQNVFVVPDCRDEGIGSKLLEAAERRLVEVGVDVVTLEVMADNDDARRFYRRHGYSPHRVELEKSVESDTLTKE